MKRIAIIILAAILCVGMLVSCADEEVPEGMYKVSLDSEPFILYVPKAWTDNSDSGISGAFFSPLDKITVSARYDALENSDITLEEYVDACINGYNLSLEEYNTESMENTVLCGEDAVRLEYSFVERDVKFVSLQMITKSDGNMILLSFYCPDEVYENYLEQFEEIIDVFVIRPLPEGEGDDVSDKKTPEGMKIASSDDLEYRFYVPKSWVCSSESGKSQAYFDGDGRPNVTVTSHSPDKEMTAEEYFEACEEEFEDRLEGYEFIGKEERKLDGKSAVSYTYNLTADETVFRIMQTVVTRDGLVYSVTYTAPEESFEDHLEDVEDILDAFDFR